MSTDDPKVRQELERQLEILSWGTTEITPRDEFTKMLQHSIESNTPLNIKCGIDPTAPDIHLGHLVPYRKMRQFQDLGHQGIVVIGDYTASIGDPTGKNESRPRLESAQVKDNAKRYMEQVFTVLDEKRTTIRYQSERFSNVTLKQLIGWAAQTTVAKLLSHETFGQRLERNEPLSLHELFYPLLQGRDSVEIKADVELGGSDQKFNVLMGRDYQRNHGMRPQVAMLLPIITGTCGTQKMSKSLGNYIAILDEPFDKFGKVMSIPDQQMEEYCTHLSSFTPTRVEDFVSALKSGELHPNEAKKILATDIVALFHGEEEGVRMRERFEQMFKRKQLPDDIPTFKFTPGQEVVNLLFDAKLIPSKGEGRRLFKQGAVTIFSDSSDEKGQKLDDPLMLLDESHNGSIIKVGKRKFLQLS